MNIVNTKPDSRFYFTSQSFLTWSSFLNDRVESLFMPDEASSRAAHQLCMVCMPNYEQDKENPNYEELDGFICYKV